MKKAILALAVLAGLYGCVTPGMKKEYTAPSQAKYEKADLRKISQYIDKEVSELEQLNKKYKFEVAETSKTLAGIEKTLDETGEFNDFANEIIKTTEDTHNVLEEYRKIKENEK